MLKQKFLVVLSCLLLYSSFSAAQSAEGIVFHDNPTWSDMLKLAQEKEQIIFMDCYTTWCGPCKLLARDIFPLKEVGDYFNQHFINVKYDMEKGEGKMLHDRYKKNIVGYPTLLFINKKGEVVQQMAGYKDAAQLIAGAKRALEGRDLFTLSKEYHTGNRQLDFLCEYVASLNNAFLKDSARIIAEEYLGKNDPKELDKDKVWNAFGRYITDVNSPTFAYLVRNAARYGYALNRDRFKINQQISNACTYELRRLFQLKYDEAQKSYLPLNTDTVQAQKMIALMEQAQLACVNDYKIRFYVHKLLLNKQYNEAWKVIKLAHRMKLNYYNPLNMDKYIRYLVTVVNDKSMLKEFLQTLDSFVNSSSKQNYAFTMYETMANINQKLGKKSLARQQMEKFNQENEKARKSVEQYFKK